MSGFFIFLLMVTSLVMCAVISVSLYSEGRNKEAIFWLVLFVVWSLKAMVDIHNGILDSPEPDKTEQVENNVQ